MSDEARCTGPFADDCPVHPHPRHAARAALEAERDALASQLAKAREMLSDGRAGRLRLCLFQIRDAQLPPGWRLTDEAKAKMYDIVQSIVASAIAADDRSLDTPSPTAPAGDATLPYADVWRWTCHRCGYHVESVDQDEMQRCRAEHLDEHGAVPAVPTPGIPRGFGPELDSYPRSQQDALLAEAEAGIPLARTAREVAHAFRHTGCNSSCSGPTHDHGTLCAHNSVCDELTSLLDADRASRGIPMGLDPVTLEAAARVVEDEGTGLLLPASLARIAARIRALATAPLGTTTTGQP